MFGGLGGRHLPTTTTIIIIIMMLIDVMVLPVIK
jgi:hypothetical protein